MTETQEQREARWAASRARQAAYAADPQRQVERAARIAAGLCVIEQPFGEGTLRVCVTHDVPESFDHYLSVSPRHSAQGIATND